MGQENAYSLLELMITIFISMLLVSGAALSVMAILEKGRLAQGSEDTFARLEHFAAMSGIRNSEYRISFADSTHIEVIAPAMMRPGEARSWIMPKGVRITRAQFGSVESQSSTLILRPDGSATPGTIVLSIANGRSCTITQALRGARKLICTPA